jgi:hypothetical protein
MPWDIQKNNYPSNCNRSLFIYFFQFDFGCTSYNPCWAYAEWILSHTEHTGNWFHRMLSILGIDFMACWACAERLNISAESNTIFKNLVLKALGTIRFRFPQKKSNKKFHACVPLKFVLNRTVQNSSSNHFKLTFLLNQKYEDGSFKGTQDWEFFWLRFWNLRYFFASYA